MSAQKQLLGLALIVLSACSEPSLEPSVDGPSPPPFANLRLVEVQGYDGELMEPFISRDGNWLFFNNSNAVGEKTDLFSAKRLSDTSFQFVGPVQGANVDGVLDAVASMDANGKFYFTTIRSYDKDLKSLYRGNFAGGALSNVAPVEGVSHNARGHLTMDAEVSGDGQTLYLSDAVFTGGALPVSSVIEVATARGGGFELDPSSAEIFKQVNSNGLNYAPSISANGLELFFTRIGKDYSDPHIYVATRKSSSEPFSAPALLNSAEGYVEAPSLSGDGRLLYFHKKTEQGFRVFVLQRQ